MSVFDANYVGITKRKIKKNFEFSKTHHSLKMKRSDQMAGLDNVDGKSKAPVPASVRAALAQGAKDAARSERLQEAIKLAKENGMHTASTVVSLAAGGASATVHGFMEGAYVKQRKWVRAIAFFEALGLGSYTVYKSFKGEGSHFGSKLAEGLTQGSLGYLGTSKGLEMGQTWASARAAKDGQGTPDAAAQPAAQPAVQPAAAPAMNGYEDYTDPTAEGDYSGRGRHGGRRHQGGHRQQAQLPQADVTDVMEAPVEGVFATPTAEGYGDYQDYQGEYGGRQERLQARAERLEERAGGPQGGPRGGHGGGPRGGHGGQGPRGGHGGGPRGGQGPWRGQGGQGPRGPWRQDGLRPAQPLNEMNTPVDSSDYPEEAPE